MVIVTRSAYKKACESFNSSDISQKNIIPPWCSSERDLSASIRLRWSCPFVQGKYVSLDEFGGNFAEKQIMSCNNTGKVYERSKSKKVAPKWEMRSTYPLRANIWEYLYEDNVEQKFNCSYKRRHRSKHTSSVKNDSWKSAVWLILMIGAVMGILVSVSLWRTNTTSEDLTNKAKLMTLPGMDTSSSLTLECCNRMKYLAEQLARAEQILRNTLRSRTMMLTVRTKTVAEAKDIDTRYIDGATASKGSDTTEWGGRVALWGVVPLWRAAPPPDTILALRRPTLSDCWPFIGSYGEIIIRLPQTQRVHYVTLEHIRPDTARSAPKHFLIYGILANNTWIKVVDGHYRAEGPAKQYYPLHNQVEWKSLVFRVLTNQGNKKYTCVYRVHLYGKVENSLVPFTNK